MNSNMMNSKELTALFFTELKKYNATNFKTLQNADLTQDDPVVKKCFSAVITRYVILQIETRSDCSILCGVSGH